MEKWVKEIVESIDQSRVVLEGQEGSCSRICKVISNSFNDMSLLKRHRAVKKVLEKHFAESLHALSIQTYTEEEWENARADK
ncbi:MAG: hypothetical protein SP4CHLAM5_00410 [Chlamydiia bacterium]|nr:hypothetical protein [Chlamydiia bacterium]MCH9617918.1 hypothetical protein [Chlamydiia bacterium]MCH9624134.1 hypothetical protein [Chlamydiia bacterium]